MLTLLTRGDKQHRGRRLVYEHNEGVVAASDRLRDRAVVVVLAVEVWRRLAARAMIEALAISRARGGAWSTR
jgi:hypothetical protein